MSSSAMRATDNVRSLLISILRALMNVSASADASAASWTVSGLGGFCQYEGRS